ALKQLSRAEATNDLNAFLLSDAGPSGKTFTAGELLQRAEQILESDGLATDDTRIDMLIAIGFQYNTLDLPNRAHDILARAYALAPSRPDRTLRAKAACALADMSQKSGDSDRAESLIQEGLGDLPAGDPASALDRVFCLCRGSFVARENGEVKQA